MPNTTVKTSLIILSVILVFLCLFITISKTDINTDKNNVDDIFDTEETTAIPYREGYITYVLPQDICGYVFFCRPEEFSDIKVFDLVPSFLDGTNEFLTEEEITEIRTRSEVDAQGNLLLYLTQEEKEQLMLRNEARIKLYDEAGMTASQDYTKVMTTGYMKDDRVICNSKLMPLNFFHALALQQLLTGKDPSDITLSFTIEDEQTGETLYKVDNWLSGEEVVISTN